MYLGTVVIIVTKIFLLMFTLFNSPSNTVLSAALDVQSDQIETLLAAVEKVVPDVVHKAAVKPGQEKLWRF